MVSADPNAAMGAVMQRVAPDHRHRLLAAAALEAVRSHLRLNSQLLGERCDTKPSFAEALRVVRSRAESFSLASSPPSQLLVAYFGWELAFQNTFAMVSVKTKVLRSVLSALRDSLLFQGPGHDDELLNLLADFEDEVGVAEMWRAASPA
jgi:hypothetical protein